MIEEWQDRNSISFCHVPNIAKDARRGRLFGRVRHAARSGVTILENFIWLRGIDYSTQRTLWRAAVYVARRLSMQVLPSIVCPPTRNLCWRRWFRFSSRLAAAARWGRRMCMRCLHESFGGPFYHLEKRSMVSELFEFRGQKYISPSSHSLFK